MTAEEIKKHVDAIIKDSFDRLQYAYPCSKPKDSKHPSRLIFPKYRRGELRISEQELRFSFVEAFIQYCNDPEKHPEVKDWHYSVETPTREIYSFSGGEPRVITEDNGKKYIKPEDQHRGFKSGNFDFVIHNANNVRICLIEFKGDCRSPKDYYKDFEKLIYDMKNDLNNVVRYFIQIVESQESIDKITEKLKGDNNQKKKIYQNHFTTAIPKTK